MTAIAVIGGVLIIILIIFTVFVVKNVVKENAEAKNQPERPVPGQHIKDFKNIVEPEKENRLADEKEVITVGADFLDFAENRKKDYADEPLEGFQDNNDDFDFEYDYKTRSIDEADDLDFGRFSRTSEDSPRGGKISVTLKYNDGDARKVMKMVTPQITVGRSIGNDLLLNGYSFISKKHAVFTIRGNKLYLKDLDSRNGTGVNGQRIRGEVLLRKSCEVNFGKVKVKVNITEDE